MLLSYDTLNMIFWTETKEENVLMFSFILLWYLLRSFTLISGAAKGFHKVCKRKFSIKNTRITWSKIRVHGHR